MYSQVWRACFDGDKCECAVPVSDSGSHMACTQVAARMEKKEAVEMGKEKEKEA